MNDKTKSFIQRIKKFTYLYFISVLVVVVLSGATVYTFGITSAIVKILISAFGCFYGIYAIYNESFWLGNNDRKPFFNLKKTPARILIISIISLAVSMILSLAISYTAILIFKLVAFLLPSGEGEVFTWSSTLSSIIFGRLLKACVSPFYWASRLLGGVVWIYPAAMMIYPVSASLGYIKGWDTNVVEKINKDMKKQKESARRKAEKHERDLAELDKHHEKYFEEEEKQQFKHK